MDVKTIKNSGYDVLYLASCALCKKTPKDNIVKGINLHDVYKICNWQSISALVYSALQGVDNDKIKNNEYFKLLSESRFSSIRRCFLFDEERKLILDFLEKNQIRYMPLKGIIIKDFYSKPFLREMSDNDILYDSTYTNIVSDFFISRGYEKYVDEKDKDESYRKAPVYNFEMHRELFEEEYPEFHIYYSDVEKKLIKDLDSEYSYHMTDEDFYIYMIAHTFKHFTIGGTGLRGLFDNFVYLSEKNNLNWEYIQQETSKLGILQFEKTFRSLCFKIPSHFSVYNFSEISEEENNLLMSMLYSGTYGSGDNVLRNNIIAYDNSNNVSLKAKVKFLFSRLFPSYNYMHGGYSNVVKNRFLLPYGYVYRIVRIVVKNRKYLKSQITKVVKM